MSIQKIITPTTPILIEKLVPGGQALATLDTGQKVFLWNALPGETVATYQLQKSKSRYLEGIALDIARPSPHRVAPADPCYLATSPWQILDYDYELEQKSALLLEAFRQQGIDLREFATPPKKSAAPPAQSQSPLAQPAQAQNSSIPPNQPQSAPPREPLLPLTDHRPLHYRNKMEYSLYWDNSDQQIHLAFHRRGTHTKIPVTRSSLEHPAIFRRATEIIADLNARHEPARKYQSLLLRSDQAGTVSGGLLENDQPHPTFPPLVDTLLGHPYTYSVTGFFQINLPVYELALAEISRHIQTSKVLDLYAGVGTIGLSVARDRDLTLVEVNPAAFAELEKNCQNLAETPLSPNYTTLSHKSQDLTAKIPANPPKSPKNPQKSTPKSPTPVLARSESALSYITPDATVILDPPRAGCDPALLARLLAVTPPTVIYLSCNPATQARDAKILLEKYRLTAVQPYNFFPRTPHLENLLVFQLEP